MTNGEILTNCPKCGRSLELLRVPIEKTMTVNALCGVVQRTFQEVLYCPHCGYPEW